jgi:hypothetical protein
MALTGQVALAGLVAFDRTVVALKRVVATLTGLETFDRSMDEWCLTKRSCAVQNSTFLKDLWSLTGLLYEISKFLFLSF